jgi:transposase-like protein
MSKLRKRYSKEEKLQIVKESIEENVSNEDLGRRYNIHPIIAKDLQGSKCQYPSSVGY